DLARAVVVDALEDQRSLEFIGQLLAEDEGVGLLAVRRVVRTVAAPENLERAVQVDRAVLAPRRNDVRLARQPREIGQHQAAGTQPLGQRRDDLLAHLLEEGAAQGWHRLGPSRRSPRSVRYLTRRTGIVRREDAHARS